jgi:hypothetical protein
MLPTGTEQLYQQAHERWSSLAANLTAACIRYKYVIIVARILLPRVHSKPVMHACLTCQKNKHMAQTLVAATERASLNGPIMVMFSDPQNPAGLYMYVIIAHGLHHSISS